MPKEAKTQEGDDGDYDFSKPGELGEPYKSEEAEIVSKRSANSVSEVHLAKNQEKDERFIRLINRYKTPYGKKPRMGFGFNIYNGDSLSKLIETIKKFATKLGWKPKGLGNEELDAQAEVIAEELNKKDARIAELEDEIKKEKADKETYVNDINKKHAEELAQLKKDAEKIRNLETDLSAFADLINKFDSSKQSEEDIQKFLEGKKWFFGLNVVSARPKTRAGASKIFDFLLTYTDGSQRILELKLPTEKILDKEGMLAANVAKGLDQLIDYLKQTVAIAHSQLPESEYIKEKKPRGILVIGRRTGKEITEKITSWNYALNWAEIKTYDNLIDDAGEAIKQIKEAGDTGGVQK